jgi:hypothetical protein
VTLLAKKHLHLLGYSLKTLLPPFKTATDHLPPSTKPNTVDNHNSGPAGTPANRQPTIPLEIPPSRNQLPADQNCLHRILGPLLPDHPLVIALSRPKNIRVESAAGGSRISQDITLPVFYSEWRTQTPRKFFLGALLALSALPSFYRDIFLRIIPNGPVRSTLRATAHPKMMTNYSRHSEPPSPSRSLLTKRKREKSSTTKSKKLAF